MKWNLYELYSRAKESIKLQDDNRMKGGGTFCCYTWNYFKKVDNFCNISSTAQQDVVVRNKKNQLSEDFMKKKLTFSLLLRKNIITNRYLMTKIFMKAKRNSDSNDDDF